MMNIKIPDGYSIEQMKNAMQILVNDPNFKTLKDIVETNDIAKMREELENPNTPEGEIKRLQYRLSVFKETFALPSTIFSNLIALDEKPEEELGDEEVYHTAESIREARG